MKNKNQLQNNIFSYIFKLSNTLQVYLDKTLVEDDLTSKQLFLMIVIDSFGTANPTFKEAADRAGNSYQNIKQIALKLEKKDYVKIIRDPKDRRAKRLILTDKARAYWKNRDLSDIEEMNILFKRFDQQELEQFFNYMERLFNGIIKLSTKMEG
ncbi:MarR family transcriptional regulator [Vallitalea longa]|uniref:MarR family transcriptional regulator n=1 Tax=Vallitalea longa TaxID=2936439 RepID=A0A9W5YH73_9FIRM|nr:MarR family winged helix-turn-helix transcriptional regulator [Vallitalea longa]GKX31869.1 MarR family transcriptional regulator [Vallitalea longa]